MSACGQGSREHTTSRAQRNDQSTAKDQKLDTSQNTCDLSEYRATRQVHFAQRSIVLIAKPVYPPEALKAGEGGIVNVDIVIDRDGTVQDACALNGPPALQLSAQKAALACKFKKNFGRTAPVKHQYQRDVITYLFVPTHSEKVDELHYIVIRPSG
ncbi:MAG: energy transducer TonB [Bryobacterales bacterium]|nr:energy transducer TonB [Bryobacterales bacterium]